MMDLTHDETTCKLLRALSRKPWDKLRWGMLHDHVEWDLGLSWPEDHYLKFWEDAINWSYEKSLVCSRRHRARDLRTFRRVLENVFGDFQRALKVHKTFPEMEIPF